jgi:hypothetical protein
MRPIEVNKRAEGLKFTSEDGDVDELKLLPPLTPDGIGGTSGVRLPRWQVWKIGSLPNGTSLR